MVQAQLYGLLPSDFAGALPMVDITKPPQSIQWVPPPTEVRDGRAVQASAVSESEFLAEHGFVLLRHSTAVSDWDRDVEEVYLPEIDSIIRDRLFPGRRLEIQQSAAGLLRRGRGTATPAYAGGVHSDAPLTTELYAANVGAFTSPEGEAWWRRNYEREDVAGFVNLDFWRVTNMNSPLEHMPIGVCDARSIDGPDIVETSMIGIAPGRRATHHLSLRYNPTQLWYYFPRMTSDELLVFKLGEYWKDDPGARPQNCFHSAFAHPDAPADAEERQSCEHRVGVLFLRN